MHLLTTEPEHHDHLEHDHSDQTPGDIIFLSAADSDLTCLATAYDQLAEPRVSLRLSNLLQLSHHGSIDTYVDQVIKPSRLVVIRILGGRSYWSYGVERIISATQHSAIMTVFVPGDEQADPELTQLSTLPADVVERIWHYFTHGGIDNALQFLKYASSMLNEDKTIDWKEPRPLSRAVLYAPGLIDPHLKIIQQHWIPNAPVAMLVFYRALLQAGNLEGINSLIHELSDHGVNTLSLAVTSLKDSVAATVVSDLVAQIKPDIILNTTAFAIDRPGAERLGTPFEIADCPVLQVIFSGGSEEDWKNSKAGLSSRDIAMNVALPEVDGRVITRAVSFKSGLRYHHPTQSCLIDYRAVADRCSFVVQLAASWIRLRRSSPAERRIAIVLANYPHRDGRLANGVGLDTPASVIHVLQAMTETGYTIEDAPTDSAQLMDLLISGVTNDPESHNRGIIREQFDRQAYDTWFQTLPLTVQDQVIERWGPSTEDPWLQQSAFTLPAIRFGNIVIAIQPARGYHIDPTSSYHDPALPPPHYYLAFYAWLRDVNSGFGAHAVIHFGKHGNLEWLPGKALALSAECFPDAVFGPIPHLYPFIVNDPGEGSQAKRRTAAVIVDHLTPPLGRAETYGALSELERLVDEYYQALELDPGRLPILLENIRDLAATSGVDKDCGLELDVGSKDVDRLNAFLCEIKELQIRTGLHIFSQVPRDDQLTSLLSALVRLPRGSGKEDNASLIRTLSEDLGLSFDPLAGKITDPAPCASAITPDEVPVSRWHNHSDATEWLEDLAESLISGEQKARSSWHRTLKVLQWIETTLRPAVIGCASSEREGLLCGLDGRFVIPGPSGAPTRGRVDVLPTGRNFYSIDPRVVPTAAAYTVGWKSAHLMLERYVHQTGTWPRKLALSAWGTSNMRTGGDDIAQAMALMGVRPTWEPLTGRVIGFEIIPANVLERPRIDVTLRISGFFRDAFPFQIELLDRAVRAISALDEPEQTNPLAAQVQHDRDQLIKKGVLEPEASRRARFRIFGSQPGSYGAGLQALIDSGCWSKTEDLAQAFIAWGGYAYGVGVEGMKDQVLFKERLADVDVVVHNQDNREHDLLDSDDYYQFEGGLTAAVTMASGRRPVVFHNDHSRPETPQVRTLEEEVNRIVRGRVVNPKWIKGMMQHGYKGAFEMVATVDYMFAFAATTGVVKDHHFDMVYAAYLEDDTVRTFLESSNPAALREMAARFLEAQSRGLWQSRSNSAYVTLSEMAVRKQTDTSLFRSADQDPG